MLPTQLLSQTLNTSLSLARVQEVNTTGVQVKYSATCFKGRGNRPGVPQVCVEGGSRGGSGCTGGPELDGAH